MTDKEYSIEVQVEGTAATEMVEVEEEGKASKEEPIQDQPKRKVIRPPCQIARGQAPIQACLRPSMWLPGVRNLHSARETWQIDANLTEVMNSMSLQLQELKLETEILELHKVDTERHYIELYSYTAECNWLDVVEIHLEDGKGPDTTVAEVVSFSSGLFPAWIPLAFVYNMLCCYVPFSGNGMNTQRIEAIRKSVNFPITVTAETKCNCCPS